MKILGGMLPDYWGGYIPPWICTQGYERFEIIEKLYLSKALLKMDPPLDPPPLDPPLAFGMLLNVCLLVLRLLFFEKFAGASKAKSINMVWGPHIARVKTKHTLNPRIGLFKAPLSYINETVLRTGYLRGPLFVSPPLRLGGSGVASFGTG